MHDFSHNFRLSLNPYYNKVRDLIQDVGIGSGTFKGVPVTSLERAENRGTMETYGFTLRADGLLRAARWNLEPWLAYTYSEGRLAGAPITFNSRHVVQAGISVLRGHWTLTPKMLYRSYTRNQDGARIAGFTTADLYARYAGPKGSGFSAYFDIKNIFDRRYYNADYGGGADHMEGSPQNPLEARAGVNYKF